MLQEPSIITEMEESMSREPDIESAEFVTFYKDRLLQQLDKAKQKHDEYVYDDTGLCDIQENLGELYIKLLHMDHLSIIIIEPTTT